MSKFNLLERERKRPGSVTSLVLLLVSFILIVLALCGCQDKTTAVKGIYMAQIDISNANWNRILPIPDPEINTNWRTAKFFNPMARLALWSGCQGENNENGNFQAKTCGKNPLKKSLDARFFIGTEGTRLIKTNNVHPETLNLPGGTVIEGNISGVANSFLVMAAVFIGVGFILQLWNIPYYGLQKLFALIALFISNVVSHVSVRKMVHAFNDNFATYGVSATFGDNYFGIIWGAFATLISAATLELSYSSYCKYKGRSNTPFSDSNYDREEKIANDANSISSGNKLTEGESPELAHNKA